MARYDYECSKCKHEFVDSSKIDDRNNPKDCPKCGAKQKAKRKEVSRDTVTVLKGKGWYRDGY